MLKCKVCGKTFENDNLLQIESIRCPECSGQCEEVVESQNSNEGIVLVNAAMAFEVEQYCKKLERGEIRFSLLPMGADQSGAIKVRPDNAAAGITNIANAFSHGGLSTCYQILVAAEDYERAKELVGQNANEPVPNEEPPPESAFTDPGPDLIGTVGPKGIWGWNTIPILNLVAIVGGAFYMVATLHFPLFFNGTMWAFWTKECEAYNLSLGCFIAIELACNLFMATVAVYALILVAKRSATYPSLTTKLFWISAIGVIIDLAVARHFNLEVSAKEAQEAFRGTVFAMIWMAYFSRSVRIKNTFVNAPMRLRKVFVASAIVMAVSALFCWIGMHSNAPQASENPVTTYICFLQTRECGDAEKNHIGRTALVSDAQFSEKSSEIELRLKDALGKAGSDDAGVSMNDQDNIILAYSLKEKIADSALQKIIDEAELPIKLDLIEQREYVSEETK